jgi:hypothetical protein
MKAAYLIFGLAISVSAQQEQTLSVQPDSPRWKLEGEANPPNTWDERVLYLNGGGATLNDLEMRDGIIDVDVATPAIRGFFGIQFRVSSDDANGEWIYLRPHKSGLPDAMQYTPVLNTGLNWQIYSGPGFIASIDVPKNEWFHLRLEVAGARARFYVKDMEKTCPCRRRPQKRDSERSSGIGRADGGDLLFEFRVSRNGARCLGAALPFDAAGDVDQMELVAVV